MFKVIATFTARNGDQFKDALILAPFPDFPEMKSAWGSVDQATRFETIEAAAAAYRANRPRKSFLVGRVVDVVRV